MSWWWTWICRTGVSYLLGREEDRNDSDADTIVHHMIDRPRGVFDDLVQSSEGVDIVPSHNMLERLGDVLGDAASIAEQTGETFNKYTRLRYVLQKNDVQDRYDAVIVDPPATSVRTCTMQVMRRGIW